MIKIKVEDIKKFFPGKNSKKCANGGVEAIGSDAQFWIDWLVKDGKIKEGQFKPSDIYTNEFNPYYKK